MRIPLVGLALLVLVSAVDADNWPRFRGPNGDGHADTAKLPIKWDEKENVVWKTAIHDKGWSSPVVWGDQVWMTTAAEDGHEMFAVCVDRASGKIVHDLKIFDVAKPDELHNKTNTYASPTPAIEEGRVYVHFGSYGTACLDTHSGKPLWTRRDLKCDHFRGPASSPILYNNLLILTFDGFDFQYVIALDKTNGKTVWRKDRSFNYEKVNGDNKKAYSTPAILTINGKPQLVSPSAVGTIAYDPQTGEELWKVYHGGMNVAAPPVHGAGLAILCTGDGGDRLLGVRPDGSGDVTKTHVEWTLKKNVPSHASPIVVGDLVYMTSNDGFLSCVEAKTGNVVWTERLGGGFWASPIYASGRLYFFNDAGSTVVGEAGRTWKKLAENKLDDGCMASPAVVGDSLFVRTKTHLYRIEAKK